VHVHLVAERSIEAGLQTDSMLLVVFGFVTLGIPVAMSPATQTRIRSKMLSSPGSFLECNNDASSLSFRAPLYTWR
jgi:hypothetical protein